MWWREPVTSLKGIGIKKALEFQKLNIETVGDLLNRFPRMDSYLDYSKVKRIGELTTDNEKQLFTGEVFRVADKYSGRGKRYTVITVQDDGSYADIFLFAAQRYQARKYKSGMRLIVIGKVRRGTTAKFVSEAFIQIADRNESINALGILPVYSLTGSLTQVAVRTAVKQALAKAEQYLPETLPASIITSSGLAFLTAQPMASLRFSMTLYLSFLAFTPLRISSIIALGFSVLGLSDVITAKSASSVAIFPIMGRVVLSLSPPHPKSTTTRPFAYPFTVLIIFSTASGV